MIEFSDAILKLYSGKVSNIHEMLSISLHRSKVLNDDGMMGIHTGCFFLTSKNTLMDLIYSVKTKELVFQKSIYYDAAYQMVIGEYMISKEYHYSYGNFGYYNYLSKNDEKILDKMTDRRIGNLMYYRYTHYNVHKNEFISDLKKSEYKHKRKDTLGMHFVDEHNKTLFIIPIQAHPPIVKFYF